MYLQGQFGKLCGYTRAYNEVTDLHLDDGIHSRFLLKVVSCVHGAFLLTCNYFAAFTGSEVWHPHCRDSSRTEGSYKVGFSHT